MAHSIKISEPNLGREVTFTSDSVESTLFLARSWLSKVEPTVGELIKANKPPTQGVVAQGFEAFGPMGERHGSA